MREIKKKFDEALRDVDSLSKLEEVRITFLSKSGLVSEQLKKLASLPPEEKKNFGAQINSLKNEIENQVDKKKEELENLELEKKLQHESIDITLPIRPENEGKIHPISKVIEEALSILEYMGFEVATGPDIEDDYHNFTALNFPEYHPAREMHDTFFLPDSDGRKIVLRTHTSPVQIRAMKAGPPPYRIACAGRTYRSDSDMTHSPMFHQIEGLYIDKNINMGHLKHCLLQFLKAFFELDDLKLRFRPSFFPFTEPSAEVDIGCNREGARLEIGKGNDWLEVLGCGMVHPNVLQNAGIDSKEWQGFAFGMGVERLAMLKYGIADLRTFFESDIRWLKHYGFSI